MKISRLLNLLFIMVMSVQFSNAQNSNAIIFCENGERFTVILNGLKQNEKPETNVKVEGLNAEFYKLKIIFEDAALGISNFNMGIEPGTETTYIVKKNNKNIYVLRPMSMVPIAQAPPTSPSSSVVMYNQNATPGTGETVTQQTTTTTTTTGTPGTGAAVSFGINVNEGGGNINMNMSGMDGDGTVVTQHTTTTTTYSSSSSGSSSTGAVPPPAAPVNYLPGYNGPVGCPVPVSRKDFDSMKSSISSKTFEESKLTISKQIINSQCLFSGQVKEIMALFTFEDSKLDFAKYAYGRTYDIGNYYQVNDAFTFESSIDDLNKYIGSFRR